MNVDIHTLAGAYALDAVDDLERRAFDRHLAECEACEIEIAELRATLGRLGEANSVLPPPRLKTAVMAEISRTRQSGSRRTGTGGAGSGRMRRWSVAAAAAVVIAAGAGTAGYLVERPRAQVSAEAQAIAAVMRAPDAKVYKKSDIFGGDVTVVASDSLDEGVALATNLQPLAAGKHYHLWLVHATATSAGAMPAGATSATDVVRGVRGASAFGLSVETSPTPAQPTGPQLVPFT
jgi:anti-sigma-K factor RskA